VIVPEKMVLKITSFLVFCMRRIKARCKDLVKVTVKFVRRGTWGEKERSISCSSYRKREQGLKMVVPNSYLYIGELGEIRSQR
jgi:hypothetical protein